MKTDKRISKEGLNTNERGGQKRNMAERVSSDGDDVAILSPSKQSKKGDE
jgi:hypothetical protein